MNSPSISYVVFALCVSTAITQFTGLQQPQFSELDRRRQQLSAQQQGHILSDIQQHQHRFNLHKNVVQNNQARQQTFLPQQRNQIAPQQLIGQVGLFSQHFNQENQINGQSNLQSQQHFINPQHPLHQQQQFQQPQQQFIQPQLRQQQIITPLINAPSNINTPGIVQPHLQFLPQGPSNGEGQQINNKQNVVQHHTQTVFQPGFQQNNQVSPPVPTINPNENFGLSTFAPHRGQQGELDPAVQQQRIKELNEKQAIIEKHNKFVEQQYEKALKKAQEEHKEFLDKQSTAKNKLYQTLYKASAEGPVIRYTQAPRLIFPEEAPLFGDAIKQYYIENPTTTTTTTTTTPAPAPSTAATTRAYDISPNFFLQSNEAKLLEQLKSTGGVVSSVENVNTRGPKLAAFLPTALPEDKPSSIKPIQSLEDLDQLKKQYKSSQLPKDDLLAQLKLAIGSDNPEDAIGKNVTSREISLPNGQKIEIIRTSDPNLIPGATPLSGDKSHIKIASEHSIFPSSTSQPPKAVFDELTKGVLPPGADFELIKQGANGKLEGVDNASSLSGQKKVTFVLLEEQTDGSFKVQGVKGNGNGKEKSEVDVDSILKRIKDGDIKLPPSNKKSPTGKVVSSTTPRISSTTTALPFPADFLRTSPKGTNPDVTVLPNSVSSSEDFDNLSTIDPTVYPSSKFTEAVRRSTVKPTQATHFSTPNDLIRQASQSTATSLQNSLHSSTRLVGSSSVVPKLTSVSFTPTPSSIKTAQPSLSTFTPTIPPSSVSYSPSTEPSISDRSESDKQELAEILKSKGMYAMAKFLKQSGLDTILNETGPYTVFAPTDKAFRTLLVQLGGPERAEEKFRENPRLLSGLLLHHVIPGAFPISALQDEMTGVSLAGTQLRVNQYKMQDVEWNEVKVTTINGAKVLDDLQNVEIPQGIAHAVDRVMFPLPVGDIVQTLQSDRERRFTTFLRAIFASGLAELLQGTKTYTVFAPTERAFQDLKTEELTRLVTDRTQAKMLVMRHTIPGTMFTTGMRFYQVRESLQTGKELTLSKSSGRVKVNDIQISAQNIPTTNGVIHAIDELI